MSPASPKYERIDLADADNVRYWAGEFGITPDAVGAFVHQFGTDPAVIRTHIEGPPHDRVQPEADYTYDPLRKPHTG